MSFRFNHANTVETGSGRNGEKLVEASNKALFSSQSTLWKLLGKLVSRRPFSTSFSLPRSIFSKDPCKFVMQIDFQRSDSSCSSRKTYPSYSIIIKHRFILAYFMFTMTQIVSVS